MLFACMQEVAAAACMMQPDGVVATPPASLKAVIRSTANMVTANHSVLPVSMRRISPLLIVVPHQFAVVMSICKGSECTFGTAVSANEKLRPDYLCF